MITRRDLLRLAGTAPVLTAFPLSLVESEHASAAQPRGPQIRSIKIFTSTGSFYRFIGPQMPMTN